jgi:hypothetical protein
LKELRRRGGEVERRIVLFDAERRIEAADGEGQAVSDRCHEGHLKPIQVGFDRRLLRAEPFDARCASHTAEARREPVRVRILVGFDFHRRACGQPWRERAHRGQTELVEPEIAPPRIGQGLGASREFGHHLETLVVAERSDEEAMNRHGAALRRRRRGLRLLCRSRNRSGIDQQGSRCLGC